MTKCSICFHPKRQEIEAALLSGRSQRSVEKEYNVSRSAISRHMGPEHVFGMVIVPENQGDTIQKIKTVVDQINDLILQTGEILEASKTVGDAHLSLKAIEIARKNIEVLAKLTGQLSNGGTNQINVGIPPEVYNRTVSHVIRALEPFPDARIAVLAALEGITVIECPTN